MMRRRLLKILLATDGSVDAQEAERAAVDLCRHTGATLHIVHTWRYTAVGYAAYGGAMTGDEFPPLEAGARAILDASATRITAAGGTLAGQHLRGGPSADEIAAV